MEEKRGTLFVLAGAVLWGTTGTAQALAPADAQPLAIGALRLMVGGVFLFLYFLWSKRPARVTRKDLPAILLAAGCMAAYQVLFFAGVKMAGVALGTIVGIGSAPVWAGLLGLLFRAERPGWRWSAATLLTITGCALLVIAGQQIASPAANLTFDPLGLLLAAGAGAAYATFSLASKGLLDRQPVEMVMAIVFSLGAVMLAPLLLALLYTGQQLRWLAQPNGLLAVLHLGLFATALAYIFFGQGLKRIPLATAVTLSLAEPLTAGMLGVLLLGERISPLSGAGAVMILSGLVVLSAQKERKRQPLLNHRSLD